MKTNHFFIKKTTELIISPKIIMVYGKIDPFIYHIKKGVGMQLSCDSRSIVSKQQDAPFDWPFFLACGLCSLPVILPTYPAMVDVPQHAAQIESIKNIWLNDWDYSHLFEITYLIPYWTGYLLCIILSFVVGPVWNVKLVVASALCAFPWCSWKFLKSIGHLPKQLRWLLLPISFGFAYEWGFLNFIISIPLGFFIIEKIIPQSNSKTSSFKKILWAHLLFYSHILTAAVFCIIASVLMMTPWKGFKNWIYRILPQISLFPILLIYIILNMVKKIPNDIIVWNLGWHRFLDLPYLLTGIANEITAFIIFFIFMVFPIILGAKFKKNGLYFIPIAIYLTIMLFSPHYIAGNAYNYQRFGLIGYPLYLLIFNYNKEVTSKKINLFAGFCAIIISFSMLGIHTFRSIIFNQENEDYKKTISIAEPGKRLLIFAIDENSKLSNRTPFYLHFPSWYQAETKGLVDFSFASMYQIIEYKNKNNHPIRQGFEWNPLIFDWKKHQGETYDYFIFRSAINPTEWMKARTGCKTRLISQNGTWWLFKRIEETLISEYACPKDFN